MTLSSPITLYSQTYDSIKEAKQTVIRLDHREIVTNPLYIIMIADKTINYRLDNKAREETFLSELKLEWLESLNVLQGPEGVKKYGLPAEDGVILITLKEDSWKKMTPALQKRFKVNQE